MILYEPITVKVENCFPFYVDYIHYIQKEDLAMYYFDVIGMIWPCTEVEMKELLKIA